jgi:hypothetical protein
MEKYEEMICGIREAQKDGILWVVSTLKSYFLQMRLEM